MPVVLALIIIITISPFLMLSCKPEGGFFGDSVEGFETFEVIRGNIIQTVSASGNVDSKYSNSYSLKTSGDVLQALEKGDSFKKGDVLIELSSQRMQLLLEQAEENINVSQISLDLAKVNYQQALDANHVAVQLAETNTQLAELAAQNAYKALEGANNTAAKSIESSRVALENAEKLYQEAKDETLLTDVQKKQYEVNIDSAEAAHESAKAQGQSSSSSAEGAYEQSVLNQSTTYWTNLSSTQTAETQMAITASNIEQAESQLRLAQISLELVGLDSDDHILYAPYDGIVLSSVYKSGEYAGPGVPAMEIASNEFVIISEVNETDIINMMIAQEVDVSLDAYYLEQLKGKILEISPVSTNVGGVVSYKITVELEAQDRVKLMHGLSASLTIITSDTGDILSVPIEAVSEENNVQYVNILLEDGSAEKKEVVTGIFNYDFIEIKSGLSEGDIVIVSSPE